MPFMSHDERMRHIINKVKSIFDLYGVYYDKIISDRNITKFTIFIKRKRNIILIRKVLNSDILNNTKTFHDIVKKHIKFLLPEDKLIYEEQYLDNNNFMNIDENLKFTDANLVISLTTTPLRIKNIEPVINSLVNQTVKADYIILNVPKDSKIYKKEYEIPEFLANYDNVLINECIDYGPICKLIGTFKYISTPNTFIVTVDDDKVYDINMTKKLVETISGNENNFIGLDGISYKIRNKTYFIVDNNKNKRQIINSSNGVIYKRSFFDDYFYSYFIKIKDDLNVLYSYDIIVANYLYSKKIRGIVVNESYENENVFYETSLSKGIDRLIRNRKTIYKYVFMILHNLDVEFFFNSKNKLPLPIMIEFEKVKDIENERKMQDQKIKVIAIPNNEPTEIIPVEPPKKKMVIIQKGFPEEPKRVSSLRFV